MFSDEQKETYSSLLNCGFTNEEALKAIVLSNTDEQHMYTPYPWHCSVCTYLNSPSNTYCQMCESPPLYSKSQSMQKSDKLIQNIYHLYSMQHSQQLSQSLTSYYHQYKIFVPNDVISIIESFVAPKFDVIVPYYPYPPHLFNKIKRSFFYYQIRIGLIGDSNTGKSSIISQHVRNSFIDSDDSSIQSIGFDKQDLYFGKKSKIRHDNKTYDCQLSIYKDHAMIFGEANYQHSSNMVAPPSKPIDIDIYLLIFDPLNQNSFTFIVNNMEKIRQTKQYEWDKNFCVVLVANKCDTIEKVTDLGLDVSQFMISKETINAFCTNYNCPYIEVSAANNIQIEELFDISVKEAIMYKGEAIHFNFN